MLNLLVTVVWIKEIAMAQQGAVEVFMNILDGLGLLCWNITLTSSILQEKQNKTKQNTTRNKQPTWKTDSFE